MEANIFPSKQFVDGSSQFDKIEREYICLKEAAGYLCVSISKMQKMSANREIPVYKPTKGKVYFKLSELRNYMESGRQQSVYELGGEGLAKMREMRKTENKGRMVLIQNIRA